MVSTFNTLRLLSKILTFTILIGFPALYSYFELVDDFAFSTATLSNLWGLHGRIIFSPFNRSIGFFEHNVNSHSYRPFAHISVLMYSIVSGLRIEEVIFLPITAILITTVFYVLLQRFGVSKLLTLFAISVATVINNSVTMASPFYYISMGYSLAFTFVYLLLKLTRYEEASFRSMLFTVILLAVAAPWFYYTYSFIVIIALFYFTIRTLLKRKKLNHRRNVIPYLLIIALIAFANEQAMYIYIGMSGFDLLLAGIKDFVNMLINVFYKQPYHLYKPVFIRYGFLIDILNRTFLYALALTALLIIISAKVYGKQLKHVIIGNDVSEYLDLGLFLVLAIAHLIAYLGTLYINFALLWVYISVFIAYWSNRLLQDPRVRKEVKIIFHILLLLVLISGYAKQLLFIVDNTYSNFYIKRAAAMSFTISSLEYICDTGPRVKIYLIHQAYAYVIYQRTMLSNYDCSNIGFYLISPQLKCDDIRLVNEFNSLIYIHHKDIPFIRVGVAGIIENIFSYIIGDPNIQTNIIFQDNYNAIFYFPPSTIRL